MQVSNGPYGTTLATITGRPRIDTGKLGIITLVLPDDAADPTVPRARWRPTGPTATRASRSGRAASSSSIPAAAIAVGLDGEAMQMEPPLRFSIRPHALRVRLAHNAIGYSPAARTQNTRDFLPHLWKVALGHPVAVDS